MMYLLERSLCIICMQVYLAPLTPSADFTQRSPGFWTRSPSPWANKWGNKSSSWTGKSPGNWSNRWTGKSTGNWSNRWSNKPAWTKKSTGNWSGSWKSRWSNKPNGTWANRGRSNWTKSWGNDLPARKVGASGSYIRKNSVASIETTKSPPTTIIKKRTRKRTTKAVSVDPSANPSDARVKSKFTKHGIVPDIIPVAPEHEIELKWVDKVIDLGTRIKPNITRRAPTVVKWPVDGSNHVHTLIMIDPDVPSRKDPWKREWQHWVVVNIPWGKVWAGEELTAYRGIKECHGPGLHRYIFLVYHQPGNELLHCTEPRLQHMPVDAERSYFSTRKFVTKYKLGDPVAGNFFVAKWEPYDDILHPYSPLHNFTLDEKDVMNEFEHRFTVNEKDINANATLPDSMTTEDYFDIREHIKNL